MFQQPIQPSQPMFQQPEHSRIKKLLIILAILFVGIVLGAVYKISKEKSAEIKPAPVETGEKDKVIESLTAPAGENSGADSSAVDKKVIDSLTAPAQKGSKPTPISQDVLDSITAPAN